jgi:hypothetical protein
LKSIRSLKSAEKPAGRQTNEIISRQRTENGEVPADFSRKSLQNGKKDLQCLAESATILFCEAAREAIRKDR